VLGENFKILTGNDTISGRGMRENEQAIPIRCKLLICANDNIKFDAASKSFADRLCVIPFKNEVQNPDPWLFDRLMTEAPGILASLIEEAKAFYADSKLPSCHAIEEATRAYVRNADRYAEWLEECYEPVAIPANVRQRIEALTDLPADAGPYSLPLQTMFRRWQIYADNRKEFVGQSRLLAQALRGKRLDRQASCNLAERMGRWSKTEIRFDRVKAFEGSFEGFSKTRFPMKTRNRRIEGKNPDY
jgi:phage/plasmid-associated DNA primase